MVHKMCDITWEAPKIYTLRHCIKTTFKANKSA